MHHQVAGCWYEYHDLGGQARVGLLRDRVGHADRLEARVVDLLDRAPAEDAVRADGVHLLRAGLDQLVGREAHCS